MVEKIVYGAASLSILIAAYAWGYHDGKTAQRTLHQAQAALVAQQTAEATRLSFGALMTRVQTLAKQNADLKQIEEALGNDPAVDTCAIPADRLRAVGAIRNPG